jgi:hypothetical protein
MKTFKLFLLLIALITPSIMSASIIKNNRGLSQYDSTSFSKKLPIDKNNMDCNTDNSKQFINSILDRDGITANFIGGFKVLKKSKDRTYCSVNYKNNIVFSQINFWIINDQNETRFVDYTSEPIACDDETVVKMIEGIAEKRKIKIEEIGGYSQDGLFEDSTKCSVAYKTSDIESVIDMSYEVHRDEDYNIVLKTDFND